MKQDKKVHNPSGIQISMMKLSTTFRKFTVVNYTGGTQATLNLDMLTEYKHSKTRD